METTNSLDSRTIASPNISYSFEKESTHMDIWMIGINSKKQPFLLRKHSIVNSTCLGLATKDYEHASRVWSNFGIKDLGEYQDLYLCMDVILLANAFESFRKVCSDNYGLDPAHFYTAPGLAWKACSKKTKIKLELLLDPDMLLMFERGIRGGITNPSIDWLRLIILIWVLNTPLEN